MAKSQPLPEAADQDAEHEAEADRDVAEGRTVPHGVVRDWLKSIIAGAPKPTPYSWRK